MAKKHAPITKACPSSPREKGEFAYAPSKKTKRGLYEIRGENIPENLKTRGEKRKESIQRQEARKGLIEEKTYFGLEKIRPVETCNIQESRCYVVVIFDGKSKAVLYTENNFKTPKAAEIARVEARRKLHARGCDVRVMRIEDFKRLAIEGYELYKRSENPSVCKMDL